MNFRRIFDANYASLIFLSLNFNTSSTNKTEQKLLVFRIKLKKIFNTERINETIKRMLVHLNAVSCTNESSNGKKKLRSLITNLLSSDKLPRKRATVY